MRMHFGTADAIVTLAVLFFIALHTWITRRTSK